MEDNTVSQELRVKLGIGFRPLRGADANDGTHGEFIPHSYPKARENRHNGLRSPAPLMVHRNVGYVAKRAKICIHGKKMTL